MYPYSVPDFLTRKERLDIKDRIFSLESEWLTLYGEYGLTNDISKRSFVLGHAAYVLQSNKSPLKKREDNISMLRDYFCDVHDKTIYFLKKKLEIDIVPFNDFTLPGFHIFRGPRKSAFSELTFHTDSSIYRFYPSDINYEKNSYSFSSLIHSTPKAHLEYKDDKQVNSSFEYKEGSLNIWSSFVPHKIGTCDIEENQYRITYQGHVFKYKGNNYMYF